jgi:multidrug efflux pump subunit AcrB
MSYDTSQTGLIAWFARNHVAANLLMWFIIVLGSYSAFTIKKAISPEIESNLIQVTQFYPGAAPEEVEQGIVQKIEEAIKDVESIKRIESRSYESNAQVNIEIFESMDVNAALDEVKIAIDSISTFPEEAEKPVMSIAEMGIHAVQLQLHGALDEYSSKQLAEQIKHELLVNTEAAKVTIFGSRDYEITVEVPESQLRKYNLTLGEVATAIRKNSLNLPAGSIRTDSGQILLRTKAQAYWQQGFEEILLLSSNDGVRVKLGDIATIKDAFVETDGFATFDNSPSAALVVYAVGDQDVISVGSSVKEFIEKRRDTLPEGVKLDYWADTTYYLDSRLNMMLKNLAMGALLVFIILAVFMELKIAFWVMLGLPLCFLGAFILLPFEPADVSINMISLFGFILVLGIVVDDAIIIGESVNDYTEKNGHSLENVVIGAKRVATPATFGVLTTICAFLPTLFVGGPFRNMPAACGYVVLFCLVFSLIESKWILPSHLAHMHKGMFRWMKSKRQMAFQQRNNAYLQNFIAKTYKPFLEKCLAVRYTTLSVFIGVLIIVLALIATGWVRYVLFSDQPGDYIQVKLEMARGTPDYKTREALDRIGTAIADIEGQYSEQYGEGFIKHIFGYGAEGRIGAFMIELERNEKRVITDVEIQQQWREKVGDIVGAKTLAFISVDDDDNSDMSFNLVGDNPVELEAAAKELTQFLAAYDGVFDIRSGASEIVSEIHMDIKPGAEALGLTLSELSVQVREAFYGAEAQRIQRDKDEVKVMVRYPLDQRKTIADLEGMYIRTSDGREVPIMSVATLDIQPGYAEMIRINREPAIPISAAADKAVVEPDRIVNEVVEEFFPELFERYPSVKYRLDGMSIESVNMQNDLFTGFAVALFGIYALLAIPLRSYMQPLIIMSVIPFGVIGAVAGHIIMDMAISMMSIFGIIALSGVVVNDSLILVDFINRAVSEGKSVLSAVVDAGSSRFRAILITSLTTFFGIFPMLLETTAQAQFVLPMAVSLAFGIVFATVISLIVVPCLYLVLDDLGLIAKSDDDADTALASI